jgi:hypothetical protein
MWRGGLAWLLCVVVVVSMVVFGVGAGRTWENPEVVVVVPEEDAAVKVMRQVLVQRRAGSTTLGCDASSSTHEEGVTEEGEGGGRGEEVIREPLARRNSTTKSTRSKLDLPRTIAEAMNLMNEGLVEEYRVKNIPIPTFDILIPTYMGKVISLN